MKIVQPFDNDPLGNRVNGWGAWLACLLLITSIAPATAQSFPALTGRVVDTANIIPDADEAKLTQKLANLETQSGRQLVVATIPTLDDGKGRTYAIEDYGYRLGRTWGIGEKGVNNGAILLVVPGDRKLRIEVGYGLEPILTDALSSVIISTQITPQFKAGNFAGGINALQILFEHDLHRWMRQHQLAQVAHMRHAPRGLLAVAVAVAK